MDAFGILKEAQKAVPAVKFALGVAGVSAAVAIVFGLIKDVRVAVFGTIIMLGLMFVLLIFSNIARKTSSHFVQMASYVLTGFFVLAIICVTTLLFTSVFWEYPRPIDKLLFFPAAPDSGATSLIGKYDAEWHFVENNTGDIQFDVVEIKKVERVGDLSRHIIEGHGESTHIVPETGQNKTVSSYEILGIYDDSYVTLTYICNINHVKDKVEHTTVGTILLRKEPGGNMLKGFWKGWKENGDPTGGPVFWRKR